MNDEDRVERIRSVAQAIVASLGHRAPRWTVLGIGRTASAAPGSGDDDSVALSSRYPPGFDPVTGPQPRSMSVTLGPAGDTGAERVTAYLSLDVPEAQAIVALASQIQDHAIEASWGEPLPPCPEHSHPLAPRLADGAAVWECPADPGHYRTALFPRP
jgi:hypothetical protein